MPSGVVSVRLDGRIERLGETSYTHKQQEAMGAAARAYLERSKSALPERKHSLVGTLAHFLIRNPIGRAMKGALAATAFFAITTTETAHEPQQRPAVEDMRSEAFANTGMETNNFMAIDIPATGALDALKDVIAHANDYPWVTTWLEQVRQKQGGDRSITRAQRLYWAGENIGVLNYSPDQMDENGLWTPHSPHIPKGAWLRLDEQGLSLRMPDGSVHTLITVQDSGQPRVTRYAE